VLFLKNNNNNNNNAHCYKGNTNLQVLQKLYPCEEKKLFNRLTKEDNKIGIAVLIWAIMGKNIMFILYFAYYEFRYYIYKKIKLPCSVNLVYILLWSLKKNANLMFRTICHSKVSNIYVFTLSILSFTFSPNSLSFF